MNQSSLGPDLAVSVIGLGCNRFGLRCDAYETKAIVHAALDAGITLLDTADSYGRPFGTSEEYIGRAIRGRRTEVVLATKFGRDLDGFYQPDEGPRGARRYVRRALEGSLTRLGTDYVDLYQYHFPDGVTPVEETLAALDELVAEGKVRQLGCTNFSAQQLVEADDTSRRDGRTRFVSASNEYSLLDRSAEAELLPECVARDIGFIPFYPLAQGLLTGKYRRGAPLPPDGRLAERRHLVTDERLARVEAIETFARERGVGLLEVALGGLAAQAGVASVIAGATSVEQVRANAAAGSWTPTPADLAALDATTLSTSR